VFKLDKTFFENTELKICQYNLLRNGNNGLAMQKEWTEQGLRRASGLKLNMRPRGCQKYTDDPGTGKHKEESLQGVERKG
jgi:hypothetical protein